MKRNIGRFQAVPYQMGGEVDEPVMPPQAPSNSPMQKSKNPQIMGAPMADPGMKKGIMGRIAAPKERLTPQSYAGEMAAQKRMKQAPTQSPLGPITGGLKSMGQGMKPQQPAANQPSMGDEWMGEVWQKLTPEEIPGMQQEVARGVGYAEGGDVYTPMRVYNQTMRDLQSGGVAGYAHGGMVEKSQEIASMGRNGDTMLMHIQPGELEGLQSLLGPVTMNPDTGNPEAFAWFAALPFLGKLATLTAAGTAGGAALGGIMGGGEGAKQGALAGLAMGATAGIGAGLGGAAAPTVAGTKAAANVGVASTAVNPALNASIAAMNAPAAASSVSPFITQGLSAIGSKGALAPGAGVLAPAFGGGLTNAQVAAAGFGPEAGGIYAGRSGLASILDNKGTSMALQGLGKATARPQRQAMGSPPPPQRRSGPMQPPPMPGRAGIEQLRRPGRNLPGNRRLG
jgi:hypothetical protein